LLPCISYDSARTCRGMRAFGQGSPIGRRLLERLWNCVNEDDYGYLDALERRWGACCGPAECAAAWADERLESVREISSGRTLGLPQRHGRHTERAVCGVTIRRRSRAAGSRSNRLWPYREWGFEALLALGRSADAWRYAKIRAAPMMTGRRSTPRASAFAAAVSVRFLDTALALAERSPPTLIRCCARRASTSFKQPRFALETASSRCIP